jgi:hypothetical protein
MTAQKLTQDPNGFYPVEDKEGTLLYFRIVATGKVFKVVLQTNWLEFEREGEKLGLDNGGTRLQVFNDIPLGLIPNDNLRLYVCGDDVSLEVYAVIDPKTPPHTSKVHIGHTASHIFKGQLCTKYQMQKKLLD